LLNANHWRGALLQEYKVINDLAVISTPKIIFEMPTSQP